MYVATINTPGYLPEDDEPWEFDTASQAWEYLAHERQMVEEDHDVDDHYDLADLDRYEISDVVDALRDMAATTERDIVLVQECLWGHTMGRRGDPLDLGLAYCVTPVAQSSVSIWDGQEIIEP